MSDETSIRQAAEPPRHEPQQRQERQRPPQREQDKPTDCGLTRAELRAIVAEIIG